MWPESDYNAVQRHLSQPVPSKSSWFKAVGNPESPQLLATAARS